MSTRSRTPAKPISPRLHGILDYGLAAANLTLPALLRLPPAVTGVFAAFGAIQGVLNAFTTQPLALEKVVPFALHGALEKSSAPLFVLAPLVAGAAASRRSRRYWLVTGAVLVAVYNLTDWKAKKTGR